MKIGKIVNLEYRKLLRKMVTSRYEFRRDSEKVDKAIFKYLYLNKLLDESEINKIMLDNLNDDKAFMFGRLGNTEANILGEYIEKKLGIRKKYSQNWIEWLYRTSGFFGCQDTVETDVDKYAQLTLEAVSCTDLFACWQPNYVDFIAKNYAHDAILFEYNKVTGHAVNAIMDGHWSLGLKGKKVLVISSFAESIKKQYDNKEKLCEKQSRCLPDFELYTYKAPETQMGINTYGCEDWFECYDKMKNEVLSTTFDVALVGCGAYGYPISADIRRSGRTAIELCSSIVKLFGIYDRRIKTVYGDHLEEWSTEYWIRPLEKPVEGYEKIERGCYW